MHQILRAEVMSAWRNPVYGFIYWPSNGASIADTPYLPLSLIVVFIFFPNKARLQWCALIRRFTWFQICFLFFSYADCQLRVVNLSANLHYSCLGLRLRGFEIVCFACLFKLGSIIRFSFALFLKLFGVASKIKKSL